MKDNKLEQKLSDCTVGEFIALGLKPENPKETFRGVNKLADILEVCYRTALNIKNNGEIPYIQYSDRIFIFKYADVFKYKESKKLNSK
jgi:hypothetical protein